MTKSARKIGINPIAIAAALALGASLASAAAGSPAIPASSGSIIPNGRPVVSYPHYHPGAPTTNGQGAGYRDWTQAQMKSLQEALIAKGYKIQATGTWDDATRGAVSAFQKKQGLKVTGFPNQETRQALGLDW